MEILLIDDHPILNSGTASVLESTGLFTVCGQAETLAQAMDAIESREEPPSIILLDLMLGEENGLDFLPMLKKHCAERKKPAPPVLVCSGVKDPFKVRAALDAGAAGFLSKAGGKAELLKAIDAALRGKVHVSDELNEKLIDKSDIYGKLTKNEMLVIDMIKAGKTNREIAEAMFISPNTVANYTNKIYLKARVPNREGIRRL